MSKREVVRMIPSSLVCVIGGALEPSTKMAALGKDRIMEERMNPLTE